MSQVFLPSVPSRYDPLSQRHVPTIDLSKAEEYGALAPLTDMRPAQNVQQAIEDLKDGMAAFTSEDYVVAVGDVILVAAAIAYACDVHGCAKVLRWDRGQRTYDCIEVEL